MTLDTSDARVAQLRCHDLDALAPKMRDRVRAALDDCHAAGLDAVVWETTRCDELQRIYFARGASKAPSAQQGWHFFGLAVDVISASKQWNVTPEWRHAVTVIFKANGMDWGGDWPHFHDYPHYQLHGLRPSPSQRARDLYAEGGLRAVWQAVGAL